MKRIEIERESLLRILNDGGAFAGKNKLIPMLLNVRVIASGKHIRIESCDNANFACCDGSCEYADPVSFCIDIKEFSSYVSSLTDDVIEMNIDDDAHTLSIAHGSGSLSLPVYASEEFPFMGNAEEVESETISIDSSILSEVLYQASIFAMHTATGNVLEGVNLVITSDSVCFCGGEHSQIYFATMPNREGLSDFNVVIPWLSAQAISRLCGGCDNVVIERRENDLFFDCGSVRIKTRLIDLKYPALSRLMQHRGDVEININKSDIMPSLKRISAQMKDSYNDIGLTKTGALLNLRYEVPAFKTCVTESIPCEGGNLSPFRLHLRHFIRVLDSCDDKVLKIRKKDDSRAPLFIEKIDNILTQIFLLAPMA